MPAILYTVPKIVKKFNTIEFTEGTGEMVFQSRKHRASDDWVFRDHSDVHAVGTVAQTPSWPSLRVPSLRERGGVASFTSAGEGESAKLKLQLSTLTCEASNDPRNVDEIYIEVEGRLPNNEPYTKRFGTWDGVCKDQAAVPVPLDLWSGKLSLLDRLVLNVWIREEDKLSGPEDVLAFQFDASVDKQGKLAAQVVGLPVLEDTQRDRKEMAITLVQKSNDASTSRSATLITDYVRESIKLQKKRVAYRASIAW